ncbi:DUF3159 domain-containing protein [Schaalia sp. ZJ1691]|uniref:DUF3159 domain-containing protein n=1 Tax=Schaalia sp. ZJ1691 TaxID=2709404 RepID=UPI0013EA50D6|nr:DUF3159 domain-containing protein [Schaalia sp. ZJ1691]
MSQPSATPDAALSDPSDAANTEQKHSAFVDQWADRLDADEFSWKSTIGGWRGLIESTLPPLIFVIVYIISRDVPFTLLAAAATALVACAIRIIERQPITQALSGLIGVGIGVIWALLSGRGEDYFIWGFITSGAFAIAILLSILIRRNIVSVVASRVLELGPDWRSNPAYRDLKRRGLALSWIWVGVFALRLAVQVPLWAAGLVAPLGIAKLVLGLPLFALACWVTWLGMKPFHGLKQRLVGETSAE